jgi:hypothetical protein
MMKAINLVRIDTGLGKTEIINKTELPEKCSIVTKDHGAGRNITVGTHFPKIPDDLLQYLEGHYALGVKGAWKYVLRENKDLTRDPSAIEYFRKLKIASDSPRKVITQARFFHDKKLSLGDSIIFDECPMGYLMQSHSITIDSVKRLKILLGKFLWNSLENGLAEFLDKILSLQENTVLGLSPDSYEAERKSLEEFIEEGRVREFAGAGNLMSLLRAKCITRDKFFFYTMIQNDLPADIPISIFSATPDIESYKAMFGDRLKVYEFSDIEPAGKLIQFVSHSYSNSSLSEPARQNAIAEILNNDFLAKHQFKFLSHKSMHTLFPDKIAGHFGALESRRDFEGNNIAVIGTQNIPEFLLRLKAHALGYPVETIKSYSEVDMTLTQYRGMEFYYKVLSTDERIKNLQLHFAWDQLMQAVGRARYYSYDSTVLLFSNLPLKEFHHIQGDIDMKYIEHYLNNSPH